MAKTRQHLQRVCVSLTKNQVETLVYLRATQGLPVSELVRRAVDSSFRLTTVPNKKP